MGWLSKLYGTTVGLDTAPLIYFVELHPKYISLVDPFFEAVERGDLQVVTSTLTLTEVLVHPFKQGNQEMADQYSRMLLNARNLRTFPVSPGIAAEAARIRAAFGSKTPDSIQLATARVINATAFLTNDSRLAALPGLELVILDSLLVSP
ncbi:MAG: type II toxin-antitoxin system VapC family toxin [Terracidiphilus sp.]|jgi:predicted nucleic acid-binding protein